MGSEFHDIDWQAARWIDRMSRPVQDAEMAAEFDRWILKDPRHVEAYARLSAIWQSEGLHCALKGSGETLAASNEPVASNDDDCRPGQAWRQVLASRRAGLGVAVMALVLAMVLAPRLMVEKAAFATPRGATRVVALSDGSTIRMNGATRIAVRITPWSRHVALEAGGCAASRSIPAAPAFRCLARLSTSTGSTMTPMSCRSIAGWSAWMQGPVVNGACRRAAALKYRVSGCAACAA